MENNTSQNNSQNTSKGKTLRNSILLVITAMIWGFAFVSQSEGGDSLGALTFNGSRMVIGALALLPAIALLDRLGFSERKPKSREDKRTLFTGGFLCGLVLFAASNSQQIGISMGTNAGKAGFLTAVYILIVPILGLFMHKKCGVGVWIGVILALIGLYLLCINGKFVLSVPDLVLLLCAFLFSLHIMVVDHFTSLVDGVRMSCIQFAVSGLLTMACALLFEMAPMGLHAWLMQYTSSTAIIALAYAGILSCGIAYTLQIIGQEDVNPTVASLLMSLESVFAVIGGWLILGQKLSVRELAGCAIIFVAILLAQIPFPSHKK